jgi:hypothetical protein
MEAFARLVTAIRPWLSQLVVVGGWAHRLHRLHRLAKPPDHLPLRTRDTDLAFSADEALAGDVRTALREAGFTEQLFGDVTPPATHYVLGEGDDGFYAEFLTPLFGSEVKSGKHDATMRKAGITAQKLRYLDLLLVQPWSVRLGAWEMLTALNVDLFLPNPTSFIVQKLLIHSDRPPHKKAQDLLYIHDSLELFGGSLGELRRLWFDDVRPHMAAKTAKKAEAIARNIFGGVTDTIREAARIPQDRRLDPENVQRACEYGLGEMLRDTPTH